MTANTLYDGGIIFTPTGNSVANNKGSVYFAGGTHLNSLRLKNTQNELCFKVSGACTVTFYTYSDGTRGIQVGSTAGGTEYGTQTASTTSWYCDITAAGVVYLSSYNGDFYFAGFEVTFPKTGQPTINTHPVSATYTPGAAASPLTVSATAANSGELSYQWYKNESYKSALTTEGATAIDGATSSSYTPSTATNGTIYYFCEITEAGNANVATSQIATVTTEDIRYTVEFTNISDYLASATNPLSSSYLSGTDGKFTIPAYADKYLYYDGHTFAGWTDGNSTYQSGEEITLTANATLSPTFTATTKTLADAAEEVEVTWNLSHSEILLNSWQGANKQVYYTQIATIGGESVSIPMIMDPTSGKIDNSGRANKNDAQINSGTKFTLPAVSGMTIEIADAYTAFSTTTIAGSTGYTKSDDGKTLSYKYNDNASTIDIIINEDYQYLKTIKVTYPVGSGSPVVQTYTTVYDIPATITSADLNIENAEGTIPATTTDPAANAPNLQVNATASGSKLGYNGDWAQINTGTILTLPGVPTGAEVTFALYNTTGLTIKGVEYTNGQTYTATADEDLTMTCTTGGYIKSITVVGTPFVTVAEPEGYTNTWYFGKENSAPEFALQRDAEYTYTVDKHSLIINTDAGKLNNASRNDKWAQCNDGTLFKVPAYEGAKLSWETYNTGSSIGFTISGTLYNNYYVATADETVSMTATGVGYISYIKIEPVTMYEVTGTISGGSIDGATIYLTSESNGEAYAATITSGGFTVKVPADTYSLSLSNDVAYVISSPSSITVSSTGSVGTITIQAATAQTVSGTIANAPTEAFTLTFTGASHTETLDCAANATSFTKDLMPDTYVMSSSEGTLSTLSVESFTVVKSAVTHNIYFPEASVPAATQQNITVDNTAIVAANVYNTVNDALAAAKAGNISSPIITLTSGQTYREQVIIDMANVTLKTSGAEKATITFYYGIGYSYYSLDNNGYYDKDRAMTRNSKLAVNPARWGATVLVRNTGNGFKAENIIFENSFNQYYTSEEVTDGVEANQIGSSIDYDRTLASDKEGYKAADTKAVTERAAAIGFENNPTGCQLYNCEFRGSQDTFYTSGKIHVKNCSIMGNTDYIFGGGNVVFDNCDLVIGGYSDQEATAYITANNPTEGEYYIFRDCTVKKSNRTYVAANLGRDWGGTKAGVYYFNLKNELGNKMSFSWNNMGGAVTAGTANLHIYDFDPTVNANYSTTGSSGANVNGLVSDEDAFELYTGAISRLGFTPEHILCDYVLSDTKPFIKVADSNTGTGIVTLSRSISAGKWSTIVLPFDLPSSEIETVFGTGASVAELTSATAEELTFTTTLTDNKIKANQPYAIRVATNFTSATINGVTLNGAAPTQTVGSWQFTGTYASGNIPQGSYFFSANQLWSASDDTNTIKPFRAYFTSTSGAREVKFVVDEASGISGITNYELRITNDELRITNGVYDLQGRRVSEFGISNSELRNGLYIVNGKKVIIK